MPPIDRQRVITCLAWVLLALAGLEAATATVLALIVDPAVVRTPPVFDATNVAIGITCVASGALVAWQRRRNPIGWLLIGSGVVTAVVPLATAGTRWPLTWATALGIALALVFFPNGRLAGWGWRALAPAVALAQLTGYLTTTSWNRLTPWSTLVWFGLHAAVLGSLILRYRRGDEVLRRQVLWLLLAAALGIVMLVPWGLSPVRSLLMLPAVPLFPAAIAVAILRYRLVDIRLVVSRVLLYLTLVLGLIIVYIGLFRLLEVVLRENVGATGAAVLTVIVALAGHPVRVRLRRFLDRTLRGPQVDPVRALNHLHAGLDAETGSLDALLTTIRGALHLPFAAFRLRGQEIAASGSATGALEVVALPTAGVADGELVIGVRAGEHRLGASELRVLSVLAIPLGATLRATMLSEELSRSRGRIVAGREEERRRLRRDLHDGLGPTLSGVGYAIDAVRNLIRTDPDSAAELLDRLRGDIGGAVAEIRRLVEGLRPPALDELGLIGALHREASRLSYRDGGNPLSVTVDTRGKLPELPAAVEVAAYRIATEAMTNAARHSTAERVRVLVTVGEELRLRITDNGCRGADWTPGVGMSSMSERAAEVGGRCTAGPTPDGGRVEAFLPLHTH
ncbi:sensor histidine kinase [Amycolatopsis anabasis]|uniref:sensor histidine kinase n=1 Tax=Amycolatopsis anabasis TaxID=1840409 RepID=UPI00131B3B82|nr:histidine kinase [Amycolatopsis anabasis]